MTSNAEYLRLVPIFAEIPAEHMETLAQKCSRRRLAKGDFAFMEGSPGAELLMIVSGRLRIERYTTDGSVSVLATRKAGEFIGEMALLDGQGRSATAVAQTKVNLLVLARTDFQAAVDANPSIALGVMRTLSLRLRQSSDRFLAVATQNVRSRLLNHMVAEANEEGVASVGPSQQVLADSIGASRETVNRALSQLVAEGKIARLARGLYKVIGA